MHSPQLITNQGRGPTIAGTRITVYSILDYLIDGWSREEIAAWLRISSDQVQAAIDYIREHTLTVITEYKTILERSAQGHPPALQDQLDAHHQEFLQLAERVRQVNDPDSEQRRKAISKLVTEFRSRNRPTGRTSHEDHGGP
jgi:uncharacterized protein (DUF433 family)